MGSKVTFSFGKNWQNFAANLSDNQVESAKESLRRLLGVPSLEGKSFLDIGCGSGLILLAAKKLGSTSLRGFDFDPESVSCAQAVLSRDDPTSTPHISLGSILDVEYASTLGQYDVVFSWGVLMFTGNMEQAIKNAAACVKPGGHFCVAIYNRTWSNHFWHLVKRIYNASPGLIKVSAHGSLFLGTASFRLLTGKNPLEKNERGMTVWHDSIDWLGGLPYEWASREEIVSMVEPLGFALERFLPPAGFSHGCNEFLFRRIPKEKLIGRTGDPEDGPSPVLW